MKIHWRRLPLAILPVVVILLLSNPGIYCMLEDRETVGTDIVYAYNPTQWMQTTQADFVSGTTTGTNIAVSPGNIVLGTASSIAPTVYAMAGGGTALFYSYLVSANKWTKEPNAPGQVTTGGKLVSDGQRYLYAFQGSSTAFWRFDAVADTWSTLASAPGMVGAGSDLYFSGGNVFAILGGGTTSVWTYDVADNSWSSLAITGTLYAFNSGASIAVAGGNLYEYDSVVPYLMRMPENGGSWSSSSSEITQPMNPAGSGADIVAIDSNTLTFLIGGSKLFRSYSISSKTWSSLSNSPDQIGTGGGLCFQPANSVLTGTSYFALAGGSTNSFNRFTTSDGRWRSMAHIPTNVGAGGGLGYVYSTTSQYLTSGIFESVVKDTGKSGQAMNSIIWDVTIPDSSVQNIVLEVRAADTLVSGAPNAAWTTMVAQSAATGSSTCYASISGISGQYVQYRVLMSTADVGATPTLSEVRLYYVGV